MAKEKQKTVEVTLDGGKKVKVVVRKPTNRVSGEAQRIGAKVWTDCIRDGIMTKKELEVVMKSNGMWDKSKQESQDAIIDDLRELEKKRYLGKKGS